MDRQQAFDLLLETAKNEKTNGAKEIALFEAGIFLLSDLLYQIGNIGDQLSRIAIVMERNS